MELVVVVVVDHWKNWRRFEKLERIRPNIFKPQSLGSNNNIKNMNMNMNIIITKKLHHRRRRLRRTMILVLLSSSAAAVAPVRMPTVRIIMQRNDKNNNKNNKNGYRKCPNIWILLSQRIFHFNNNRRWIFGRIGDDNKCQKAYMNNGCKNDSRNEHESPQRYDNDRDYVPRVLWTTSSSSLHGSRLLLVRQWGYVTMATTYRIERLDGTKVVLLLLVDRDE